MPYVITEKDVDPEFAARAIAYVAEHRKPLLEYLHDEYKIELGVETEWAEYGYEMTDPSVKKYEYMTWREYAEEKDLTHEYLEEKWGITEDQLDEDLPVDTIFCDLVNGLPGAYRILKGHIPGDWQDSMPEPEEAPYGFIQSEYGPSPGSDYIGITVSDAVALSCFQRYLDTTNSGIKIVL